MELLDDTIDFRAYFTQTDHQTKVKPASAFIDEAKDRLRGEGKRRKVYLPWDKTRENFDFRAGEVTVWSGQNGHGKTQVMTQVALSLMGQDERVVVASFEMKPHTTIARMARMYVGMNPFSPEFQRDEGVQALENLYDEFGEWTNGKLWLYDQTGTAKAETVVGMARYCAKELGITHIVIDSLMKCVRDEDDYNGQKAFVDELCALAKDHQVHVHLVHHLKKPAKEGEIPDKHDTKGSGSITDQIDNLFLVWRNKPKEDDSRSGKHQKTTDPDALLLCRKQRNFEGSNDGEPTIKLWFHRDSGQYLGYDHEAPMFFPNYPHRPT